MISIVQVRGLVRKASRLEQLEYDRSVTSILHIHQALVINGDGQRASRLEGFPSILVLFRDECPLVRDVILALSGSIHASKGALRVQANRETLSATILHCVSRASSVCTRAG